MAEIRFYDTIDLKEEVIPDVKLTRSRSGGGGKAVFYFESPKALSGDIREQISGMYMIDEEGEIYTREVKCKFINGIPEELQAIYLMRTESEWERFMRFMNRYAEENGLGFEKSKKS